LQGIGNEPRRTILAPHLLYSDHPLADSWPVRLVLFLTILLGNIIYAQEPTIEQVAKAICQIETGTTWDGKKIHGKVRKGKAGEVGPWQILPATAKICRATGSQYQQFTEVYRYFRSRTSSPRQAFAAFHRGLSGQNSKAAQAYAERVCNLLSAMP
jgi:hypothetical protein